jgi:hypothetical protein
VADRREATGRANREKRPVSGARPDVSIANGEGGELDQRDLDK